MTKTPKPARAPAPEPEDAAAPAPAPEPEAAAAGADTAGEQRRSAVPDIACGEAVRAFLEDWNADRPAEAAAGSYGATERDRWAGQSFDAIPDGTVFAAGWAFVFVRGRFVGAGSLDAMPPFFIGMGQPVPMTASA